METRVSLKYFLNDCRLNKSTSYERDFEAKNEITERKHQTVMWKT